MTSGRLIMKITSIIFNFTLAVIRLLGVTQMNILLCLGVSYGHFNFLYLGKQKKWTDYFCIYLPIPVR